LNSFGIELLPKHAPAMVRNDERLLRKFMCLMEKTHECLKAQQITNRDDKA